MTGWFVLWSTECSPSSCTTVSRDDLDAVPLVASATFDPGCPGEATTLALFDVLKSRAPAPFRGTPLLMHKLCSMFDAVDWTQLAAVATADGRHIAASDAGHARVCSSDHVLLPLHKHWAEVEQCFYSCWNIQKELRALARFDPAKPEYAIEPQASFRWHTDQLNQAGLACTPLSDRTSAEILAWARDYPIVRP